MENLGYRRHFGAFAARTFCQLLAPAGARTRLTIVIYHRVLNTPDPILPDEDDTVMFDWQMGLLAHEFNVLPLGEAVERLERGELPARAACITFDDGYRDNALNALPVLKRYRLPATFFIASGFLDGECMWNDVIIESIRRAPGPVIDLEALGDGRFSIAADEDRRHAAMSLIDRYKYLPIGQRQEKVEALVRHLGVTPPAELMMRPEHVRALYQAGMEIGGHTVWHPILKRISVDEAQREIAEGREALEGIIGDRVRLFAYPNGKPARDYGSEHVALVRRLGFRAAVSTAWGAARTGSDVYQLPRFGPWDQTPMRFHLRLLQNLTRAEALTV